MSSYQFDSLAAGSLYVSPPSPKPSASFFSASFFKEPSKKTACIKAFIELMCEDQKNAQTLYNTFYASSGAEVANVNSAADIKNKAKELAEEIFSSAEFHQNLGYRLKNMFSPEFNAKGSKQAALKDEDSISDVTGRLSLSDGDDSDTEDTDKPQTSSGNQKSKPIAIPVLDGKPNKNKKQLLENDKGGSLEI